MTIEFVFRKGGIPTLAWPSNASSSSTSSWPCSLVIKVDKACGRAAIVLHFELPIHGFDTDQRISLVYNADNWVSGEMKRGQEAIKHEHIEQLARAGRGSNKLDSLTVVLKHPCTVLCPGLAGNIAPRDDSNYPQQVVDLAKATKISMVFDGAWLRHHKSELLSSLLGDPNLVKPFSRDSTQGAELDWTAFTPRDSASYKLPPPAYGDTSLKRLERSPTSSPNVPPKKRPLLNLGSPTEKATTITGTPSPRLPPSSPVTDHRIIQDAVAKAVAEKLPDVVRAVLPDILAHILGNPTSPLSSQTTPSPSNPTSTIQRFILDHLTTQVNELTQQVTSDTLEHANKLRDRADDELRDLLQLQTSDLTLLREDHLMEMSIYCDNMIEELKQNTSELVEAQVEVLEEACLVARDDVNEFIKRRRDLLRVQLELLQPRVGRPTQHKSRRAESVPRQIGW